jgi:hypothetical protein
MTRSRAHASLAFLLMGAAALLHAYAHSLATGQGTGLFFFLWSMAPYIICLLVLVLSRGAIHVIAAAALALALDGWTVYAVKTSDNSTAVLDYLWMPIWNTIIVVPLTMLVALFIVRRRSAHNHAL